MKEDRFTALHTVTTDDRGGGDTVVTQSEAMKRNGTLSLVLQTSDRRLRLASDPVTARRDAARQTAPR